MNLVNTLPLDGAVPRTPPAEADPSLYDLVKRVGDVVLAGGALLALSPVLLGIAVAVRLKLGGPVLFRQRRLGQGGRTFEILKFRTMLDPDPARGLETDDERMTPFGKRLRSSSLDELPELLNVLRGDMSLVGPRPLLPDYQHRYSDEQRRRQEVLPGLTGLAQISGRNSLSWDDKFDLDVRYVRDRGLLTDLGILLGTFPKVLRREGVAESGVATMSVFFGPRRIGTHGLRQRADGPGTWEVVDLGDGAVLARCDLEGGEREEAEMSIHVTPGVAHPAEVIAHAAEMLLGVARERGAVSVRLVPDLAGPDLVPLPARLGFRAEPSVIGGPAALVAPAGGSAR